jgi:hypothetical protein
MKRNRVQGTRICLAGVTTNLRQQEIDTERRVLVLEVLLQLANLRTGSMSASAHPSSSQRRPTCTRRIFGVYPWPPMTPRPPALVTAAASSDPAATFIPVAHCAHNEDRRKSWASMSTTVGTYKCELRTCKEDGVFDAEELGQRCGEGGHVGRKSRG